MNKNWLKFAALPLLAMGIAAPALGQISKGDGCVPVDLPVDMEIILTCPILIVTGNLRTFQGEQIESIAEIEPVSGDRLENSLRSIPNFQQFRRSDARSANPTSQGVTLRGLGGNASSRALVMLDDVPQADPFGGWISWPGYDALNLASIRVRRGAGQVASGPGAVAGIIELDSKQNKYGTSGRLAYGSRNSVDAKAAMLQQLGKGSISVSGSYARGDGFIPIVKSQRGSVDRGAEYEQAGIALRAVAPLGRETEMQFNMRGFTDKRERGFEFSDNRNSGVDSSIRLVHRGDWQYSALAYVQIRDFKTRFGSVAADRNSVRLVLDQFSVPSTGLGARFEVRPSLGGDTELRVGADWRRTIGETKENFFFIGPVPQRNRNAGGRTDNLGGFIEGSFKPADNLTLSLGGRIDHWNIRKGFLQQTDLSTGVITSDTRFSDRSGWEGSGRAGIAFRASEDFKLRSAAYLGWRLPTLNELYRPFRVGAVSTAANENLSPERLRGAEFGFDYDNQGDLKISATGFWNRLDNAIANVTLPASINRQRQNLDAIESKGVELDASMRLANEWKARLSYSYVDAKVVGRGASAAVDGLRPAQIPKHNASAAIGYDDNKIRADVALRYIGSQFDDDNNSRLLNDAFTVDAAASYEFADGFRAELRSENLLNAEVQSAISSSVVIERAAPRTIWIGLSKTF